MTGKRLQSCIRIMSILSFAVCIVLSIWGYHTGVLTSQQKMEQFVIGMGLLGPVLFTVLQIVQVVIPIIPGGISCLVGVILFGAVKGFACNYIGICIGSMIAFYVARYFGRPMLPVLFKQKTIEKYDQWTQNRGYFDKMFAAAIFFPVAPDDFLCYLAGTTTMSGRKFSAIIWIGKPFSIFLYSLFLSTAWQRILTWIA